MKVGPCWNEIFFEDLSVYISSSEDLFTKYFKEGLKVKTCCDDLDSQSIE
jgi:hypothetical protein